MDDHSRTLLWGEGDERAEGFEHIAIYIIIVDHDVQRSSISVSKPATAIESSSGQRAKKRRFRAKQRGAFGRNRKHIDQHRPNRRFNSIFLRHPRETHSFILPRSPNR